MANEEMAAEQRSRALIDALPYIKEFNDCVVVVKYGGSSHAVGPELDSFADDIVFLRSIGINVVVVHGGGPQVDEAMKIYGMEPEFVDGLRVTDKETLMVARMVLVGQVGREIVTAINRHGGIAVGTTGEDGRLISAHQRDERLGFVGEVDGINASILESLYFEDLVPVIAPIGVDEEGQSLNINADEAASAIAIGLGAKKLIVMSNIPGLLKDVNDPESVISEISSIEARQLIDSDSISAGMIPKIRSCVDAVDGGVEKAHIIDGRVPHSVLVELFSDAGIGTMFTSE
ncbi:MAG TPA: acetylglutamate kinase [Acidimicrobiia bacterium]|nr:acetylglutamate kinase [Acidimicrobiia bacterium]